MDLDKLYQRTIMEYAAIKDYKHDIEDATAIERGHNPSCGDDLTLLIKVEDDIIKDASFLGSGCAISTASTNMLISLLIDTSIEQVKIILDTYFKMMKNKELSSEEISILQDAEILKITSNMPARIKCATLSWHSLKIMLEQKL